MAETENAKLERYAQAYEVLKKHEKDLKEPYLSFVMLIDEEMTSLEKELVNTVEA